MLHCWIQAPSHDWPFSDFKLHLLTELEVLLVLKQLRTTSRTIDSLINSRITERRHEC